jgi:hypothetical protein
MAVLTPYLIPLYSCGGATGQGGEKGKGLLCKAFRACASFELVQHRQRQLIVSHAYQWAP